MNHITKIAVQVECDGKPYAVNINQDSAEMAAYILGAFCKDQVLQLVAMPDGCKFDSFANIYKGQTT